MNVFDKRFEKVPDYNKYMYLNGYTPEEIMEANRRKFEADQIEKDELNEMKIIVEVMKK